MQSKLIHYYCQDQILFDSGTGSVTENMVDMLERDANFEYLFQLPTGTNYNGEIAGQINYQSLGKGTNLRGVSENIIAPKLRFSPSNVGLTNDKLGKIPVIGSNIVSFPDSSNSSATFTYDLVNESFNIQSDAIWNEGSLAFKLALWSGESTVREEDRATFLSKIVRPVPNAGITAQAGTYVISATITVSIASNGIAGKVTKITLKLQRSGDTSPKFSVDLYSDSTSSFTSGGNWAVDGDLGGGWHLYTESEEDSNAQALVTNAAMMWRAIAAYCSRCPHKASVEALEAFMSASAVYGVYTYLSRLLATCETVQMNSLQSLTGRVDGCEDDIEDAQGEIAQAQEDLSDAQDDIASLDDRVTSLESSSGGSASLDTDSQYIRG